MPKNKEELLEINGFGKIKVEKYGAAILEIVKKNRMRWIKKRIFMSLN